MIFDTHLWGLALGHAFGTAFVFALLSFLFNRSGGDSSTSKAVFIGTFVLDLLGIRFVLYYMMPSLVGSFGGYWSLLLVSAISGLVVSFLLNKGSGESSEGNAATGGGVLGGGLLLLALIIVPMIQAAFNSWGTDNKRAFAKLANITVAGNDQTLPPTDQNHIVMVTQTYAAYRGSSVINTGGNNLGSIYKTEEKDYTLQSVAGHLYWIAPLVYTNFLSQYGVFATQFSDTPGFVSVDAEDPNADAKLHTKDLQGHEYHIRYLPDAYFMQYLTRYVYMSGYMYGDLEDPTLEVDDNWQPFYTITYLQRAFGNVGQKLDKVLVVNAQTGQIDAYDPSATPAWVDRVMSESVVKEYAQDWGDWHDPNSIWPNWNNQYQMQPLELEFHYNTADKPVWVMPFVNRNGNQNAAAGILLYDTHDNKGMFYPGLSGRNVGETVRSNFHDTPKNANGRLTTASVQLYTISGVPTWVAIYVNSSGQFGGIGMLDAREPNVSNVQLEPNKEAVVRAYKNYLTSSNANKGDIASGAIAGKRLTGKIARIAMVSINNTVTAFFTIEGDQHSFTVVLEKNVDLPLRQAGDTVSIEYVDTHEHQEAVSKFELVPHP